MNVESHKNQTHVVLVKCPKCEKSTEFQTTRGTDDHKALVEIVLGKREGNCPHCHEKFTSPSARYKKVEADAV